ncbi:hypothetical protein DFQ01_10816 [Paenibacillus cellulosilyticus]|uniref:Uncharacterized protein n=1 Tax=Paenibacillus cellulosilyticus TaxID=375489 RepID=A0A2V2YUI0_9BACL|nr:hypothetical protein [Paenibacillus cellulosilyticus]PWW02742.1 hypothetical protein DFQ01_10816 [Paenibacillus cellulosilyticus]
MNRFDGEGFAESLIIIILISLFVFGSKDIIGLTTAPTKVDE